MPTSRRSVAFDVPVAISVEPTPTRLPSTLVTLAVGGIVKTVDKQHFKTLVVNPSLSNPFFSGKPMGWCACDSFLRPNKFISYPTETGLIIICRDCDNFIAITPEQKMALLFSLIVNHSSKIQKFARWHRRFLDVVTGLRRRGHIERLARVITAGVDTVVERPYPRRRRVNNRYLARHMREQVDRVEDAGVDPPQEAISRTIEEAASETMRERTQHRVESYMTEMHMTTAVEDDSGQRIF